MLFSKPLNFSLILSSTTTFQTLPWCRTWKSPSWPLALAFWSSLITAADPSWIDSLSVWKHCWLLCVAFHKASSPALALGATHLPVFLVCAPAVHLPAIPSWISAFLLFPSHSKVIFLLYLLSFARSSGAQFTPYLFCETKGASVAFKIGQLESRPPPFLLGDQGVKRKFPQAYFCICK